VINELSPAEVFTATEQGFAVVGLRTAAVELALVPALGGRIISLRSLRTGRQWCWHQDRPDWLWANRAGDDFGTSPQAGVDECVPSVAACRFAGRDLPDHGEVWYQPWTLDEAALGRGVLAATVRLTVSPFVFQRAIRAAAAPGSLVFDYRLQNLSGSDQPFLWSLHPLFTITPGDQLQLPPEVTTLRLNGGLGDRPIEFGDRWDYPQPFPGVRLDQLQVPGLPKGCVKGFTGPLREGWAALFNPSTGDRLQLRWDAAQVPYCGLWLNRGHAGFHHVALEPTSGAPDALSDAVERWQQHAVVPAGGTSAWSITWEIA
jgi:hypothetical protein